MIDWLRDVMLATAGIGGLVAIAIYCFARAVRELVGKEKL